MFEHEATERMMILLSGRVKVCRTSEDGHDLMLSIRDPGDVLGELGAIDDEPHIATVTALEPVTALVASTRAFRSHLESTPRVAVALLEVIVRRFRETTIKRSQSAESDTMGRVAARILELSDRYGTPTDDGTEIEMPISQEELAQWTGASRAGVAHALHAMRELGWLTTHRRQIAVTDLESLRRRAM
jgi:CRP/FNR family cyclic AMP-dependent transcriptional regulator